MDAKYIFMLTFLVVQASSEQKKSLSFVIDRTRSMTDDIAHVRQAAKSIIDIVLNETSSQIEDIVLVIFGDPDWEFRKRTRDEAELKKALDDINLIGNPDCPEMCLSGIKMGLEESLPGSFLYVFTDASAKDYGKFEDIKTLSQEKQIQVVFVLTGDCGDFGSPNSQVYYKIAAASNGQVLTVSKENVGQVLEYVKETIKGDGTVLTSTVVHPTVGSDSYVYFNIDDKIEYALVSTSGLDVTLSVSKDGVELPGKQVTWTKNVKVLKLVGITPGSYRAAVRGSSDVSVRVFGRTDFNFAFGFSDNEQNSLKYTETQPIIGSETQLIISVKDDKNSVNIENVELLDMSDVVIRRLNLTNVGSNVYRTDKFLPPNVMFKVAVTATARSTGNPIRRVANTPVEPIKPVIVAPEITDTEKHLEAMEDSKVNIHCRIRKSKPKPHVTWYFKQRGADQFKLLPDKTDDVLFMRNVLTDDTGEYKCVAKNSAGEASHIVQLEVFGKPKFEDAPATIKEKENVPVTLKCKLRKGNPRPSITWSFQASGSATFTTLSNTDEELILPALQLKDLGEYRCVAENSAGRDERTTLVTIVAAPEIESSTPSIIRVKENGTTSVPCRLSKGIPKPTITWWYKDADSTEYAAIPDSNADVLHLEHISLFKAGHYKCVAQNTVGRTEKDVEVIVEAPARIVFIPPNTPSYKGVEGDVVMKLPCTAVGFPKPSVSWIVDHVVVEKDKSRSLYVEDDVLYLKNPQSLNSSNYFTNTSHTYECHAVNDFGEDKQTYEVTVSAAPEIERSIPSIIRIKEHAAIAVPCRLSKGFPKPTITWWYKDTKSTEYAAIPDSNADVLHLDHIQLSEAGHYKCVAQNTLGKTEKDVQVIVEVVPEIERNTPSIIRVKEHAAISVPCRLSKGFPKPTITWWYKDTKLTEYAAIPGSNADVLHLDHIQLSEAGNYKCVAQNTVGKTEKDVQVVVEVAPEIDRSTPSIRKVKEHATISVSCRLSKGFPKPTITWWYKNTKSAEYAAIPDSNADVLHLDHIQLSEAGHYKCVAQNTVGKTEKDVQVIVEELIPEMAPKVTIDGPDEMDAEYEEPLQLKCKVSGYPKPNIIWEVDDFTGKTTQRDSTIELPSNFVSVLDINKVKKNATYTCKAINKLGVGTKSIVVKTKKKPYFNVLELPKDITIEYAKEAQIHCKVDAFPPASIIWFKNYKYLKTDGNIELSADNSILYIRSMAPYIADKYACVARNTFKKKIVYFKVSISGVEPPEIKKTTYYVTAMKDSSVDIHCDVIKGKPKPRITWLYNDQYSSSFTDLQYSSDTIHMDYLSAEDKATYRCMAENIVGTDYHDIELVIEYPPKLTKTTSPRIVKNVGETVTLTCPVDGSPTPDIVWKLNGKKLLGGTHTIFRDGSIRFKATVNDWGNYECRASNSHGVVSFDTKVDVIIPVNIEPPKRGTLAVMVGTDQLLPCRADGFPAPVLSWVYHSKDPKIPPKTFSPSPTTGSLALPRIQQEQDGYYTCVAKNAGGSKNITYEVTVFASPFIKFTTKQFRAVSGDMMLRVPCYASGNPKPTITWTKDGYNLATGSEWYDMAEDGSLIIKNVDSDSAGSYVCWARNKFGANNEDFDVIVESYAAASSEPNTITVAEGKPVVVPCSVPHQRTDRVLWFKGSTKVAEGKLQLPYVTLRDAGVYTCRVSSFTGAKTGATRVLIGSKPQFINYNEKESVIEYNQGGTQVMDCRTHGVTKPEVKWLHDGVRMDYDELTYILRMYSPSAKGRYTCIVSNAFGSAQQEFVVKVVGCALDIKNDFKGNYPLMLTSKLELPKFEVVDGHVNIPRDEYIVLYCPTRFTILHEREIMVTCVNNKKFDYEGDKILYTDLKCNRKVEAIPVKTGYRCNNGKSQLIDIGFNAGKKFVPVYQVCLDGLKTVYSKLNIQPTLANILPNYGFSKGPHNSLNTMFNCNYQYNNITEILGFKFLTSDKCCFDKRQLVNPRDVAPGLSQIATYTTLNVVPHWGTCNSQNWDDVEERIRKLAVTAKHELQVWTGVAQDLRLLDRSKTSRDIKIKQQVSLYLWKVVQDPVRKASLAIIQVNVPDLDKRASWKYRLCTDVCGEVRWMQSSPWRSARRGYTYCCTLSDFANSFRYFGEFPSYTELLKDVK